MPEAKDLLTTNRKALTINLDEPRYGTFAEIGAGQEVARLFFQAGGAAGTVAKSISAYDMTFSDAIYGKAPRYVSRERLHTMLEHEYVLLQERLEPARGHRTAFFVFADTVSAKSYKGTNDCHGWMGIRFQAEPGTAPSEIILHVRMWDKENLPQQQALGIVGTNLIYGAFYYRDDPRRFIASLVDNVGADRIEVDMLRFSGPAFAAIDNRLMSLHLVELGLTNAVLFGPTGEVLQPSEVLYKKAILVERGSFRPVTRVHVDMLHCAATRLAAEPLVQGKEVVVLLELTINNLLSAGRLDPQDFLARVDVLGALGHSVLISNYQEFYRLTTYFRRYTKEMIGVALGLTHLGELFNEKYYEHLEGGILEACGRLFRYAVRLYVYPMRASTRDRFLSPGDPVTTTPAHESILTADNHQVAPHLRHLYLHLLENGYIEGLTHTQAAHLDILAGEVLRKIRSGDPTWQADVPESAAQLIVQRHLFGLPD